MNDIDPTRLPAGHPANRKGISPMVAIPVKERTPIELQARTLAASCLTEVGVNRTEEFIDFVAGCALEAAEIGAAICANADQIACEGNLSLAQKLAKAKKAKHEPPGD